MFVFFEFFAPFFEKLWIKHLDDPSYTPVRTLKSADRGAFLQCVLWCARALNYPPRPTSLCLRLYAAANYSSKKSGVNIYP